jgi:hypothetical protein
MENKNSRKVQNNNDDAQPGTSMRLRTFATWAAVLVITLVTIANIILVFRVFLQDSAQFSQFVFQQVRAVVGIPMAAGSAFSVLLILEARLGHMEFEMPGIKFRGAAGPAVIWMFLFLAFVSAIRMLW